MGKVAIIGNGNVGLHFFNRISTVHDAILFSRNPTDKAIQLVKNFQSEAFDYTIICLPDDAIKNFSDSINRSDCIILHTSGSRPLDDLNHHKSRGVVYPLQTFTKDKIIDFNSFPIFIEGTDTTEKAIFSFVKSFSTDVRLMNSDHRAKLHLAAVFVCNFTNHMYHISDTILSSMEMPFKDLQHLALETLQKAAELSPSKSQTGPAKREDFETMQKHMQLIEDPKWKEIYELISTDIRNSQA
jgi:predicted short-subunit dehydrogenase-like oxidoreductase (DUF2520 family)